MVMAQSKWFKDMDGEQAFPSTVLAAEHLSRFAMNSWDSSSPFASPT